MLKRRRDFQKRKIYLTYFQTIELRQRMYKSIYSNFFQLPYKRMWAFKRLPEHHTPKYYLRSYYRKQCFLTFSYRVPRATLGVSRFALVRGCDKLFFGPYKHR